MKAPVWLRRAAIALLVLIAIELVVRIVVAPLDAPVFTSGTDGTNLRLIPGAHGRVRTYGRTIDVSVDAHGHRATLGTAGACPHHRLDMIGDSQVFGWGLGDSETIASRLQARLGSDWRVVNHGIPGTGPLQYAQVLHSVPEDAEVLMVFTEVNDLWDTYNVARHPTRCGFMTGPGWPRSGFVCPILNLRELQIGFAAYDKLTQQRALAPIGFDPSSGVAAQVLALHVRSLFVKEGVRAHSHLHFAVLPWDGRFSARARLDYFPPPKADAPRYFDDDYDLIAAFARDPDPTTLYLPGDPHLSPRGAALFADRIAPAFAALSGPAAVPIKTGCAQ